MMHIRADQPCADFSNIQITPTTPVQSGSRNFYAKVTGQISSQPMTFQAHATSFSGDLAAWLRQIDHTPTG